ncbi:hypothetical protein D5086_001799 [Populus alba]|uniref:Uncharacterized protein n=1 Tax=Populus alba TaxID=43335 RepID=A0ACC4D159_POPAL
MVCVNTNDQRFDLIQAEIGTVSNDRQSILKKSNSTSRVVGSNSSSQVDKGKGLLQLVADGGERINMGTSEGVIIKMLFESLITEHLEEPLKNAPPKTKSQTSLDLIPLRNAPHTSKEMMLDGFRTSQTDGAFPDPVIIYGYSSNAPSRFGCLLVRVDKRVTK